MNDSSISCCIQSQSYSMVTKGHLMFFPFLCPFWISVYCHLNPVRFKLICHELSGNYHHYNVLNFLLFYNNRAIVLCPLSKPYVLITRCVLIIKKRVFTEILKYISLYLFEHTIVRHLKYLFYIRNIIPGRNVQ